MTSTTKNIWIIIFENHTEWVAANNLAEALSYFTEKAQLKITKIENTENKITYRY